MPFGAPKKSDPDVVWQGPDQEPDPYQVEWDDLISAIRNDTRYNEQWQYFETAAGLNLPAAWDKSTGTGVVVGVVDTGYRPHSDLAANILPGYDFISDTSVSNDGNGRDSDASDPGDWINVNANHPIGIWQTLQDKVDPRAHPAPQPQTFGYASSAETSVAYGTVKCTAKHVTKPPHIYTL